MCEMCFLSFFFSFFKKTGISSKLIVCGMTTNSLNVIDPDDRGMLDICGFDSHTVNVIHDFIMDVIWERCTMGNVPQETKLHREKESKNWNVHVFLLFSVRSSRLDGDFTLKHGEQLTSLLRFKAKHYVRFYKNYIFGIGKFLDVVVWPIGCSSLFFLFFFAAC